MKEKLRQFMIGRYGTDNLGRVMSIAALVIIVLGMFFPILSGLAMAIMILNIFRTLSRNTYKRSRENQVYLRFERKITSRFSLCKRRFKERKTHKYFKCPSCKVTLRIPKGKGQVTVTCTKCRAECKKRS